MSLRNVLHELFPLFKISWLDGLFQLPIKVAPLKRHSASADINVRPMDEVIFDLSYRTPFIGIGKQKRYLEYILIFYIWPRRYCWIDRDIDIKAQPVSLLNKMQGHLNTVSGKIETPK